MIQENNCFGKFHSSQDGVQIETEGSIIAGTITSTFSSANLTIPQTVCDKLFKDHQYETEKKGWSVEFLLYRKSKQNDST
jgi:hypothetical protein